MDVDVKIPSVSGDTKNSEQANQKIDAFLGTMGYDADLRAAKENNYETLEENEDVYKRQLLAFLTAIAIGLVVPNIRGKH